MSRGFGQYCPLSLASELLTRRWTLLVVSRVAMGCTRFNEIHRGLPQMSPTLLSRRLDELVHAGILERRALDGARGSEYGLSPAGEELTPLIQQMAIWGHRWARDMTIDDLDPAFLVWSMHTRVDPSVFPAGRVVVGFAFTGASSGSETFWLLSEDGKVEMCLKDPGYDVDLWVRSDLRVFIEAWRGFRDLRAEIRASRIRLTGSTMLREALPDWLILHAMAGTPRMRAGREQRLSEASAQSTG